MAQPRRHRWGSLQSVSKTGGRPAEPGSRIIFTYVHSGLIDGSVRMPGIMSLMRQLERQGEPWLFGINPSDIAQFLAKRGLRFISDAGAADYGGGDDGGGDDW